MSNKNEGLPYAIPSDVEDNTGITHLLTARTVMEKFTDWLEHMIRVQRIESATKSESRLAINPYAPTYKNDVEIAKEISNLMRID